jgi:hypothetical protein
MRTFGVPGIEALFKLFSFGVHCHPHFQGESGRLRIRLDIQIMQWKQWLGA